MEERPGKMMRPGAPGNGKHHAVRHTGPGIHDDSCRCKETSNMTPRELIKLMIHDLAFWKKEKNE